jgi:hypothetical protein
VVVVFSDTEIPIPKFPRPLAVPDAKATEQLESLYKVTRLPASPVPLIRGELLVDGLNGVLVTRTGTDGAKESSIYEIEVGEQAEELPATSVDLP